MGVGLEVGLQVASGLSYLLAWRTLNTPRTDCPWVTSWGRCGLVLCWFLRQRSPPSPRQNALAQVTEVLVTACVFPSPTDNFRYTCDICGKKYKYYSCFQEHRDLHAVDGESGPSLPGRSVARRGAPPPPGLLVWPLPPPGPLSPLLRPRGRSGSSQTTRGVTDPWGFWKREGPRHSPYILLIRVTQVKLPFL